MKKILSTLLILKLTQFGLFSQDSDVIKTPDQIQDELDQAQKDFETALSLFNPWYTGPLITSGANNASLGTLNTQAYVFLNNQSGVYSNHRNIKNIPDIFTVEPLFVCQYGFTNFIDGTISLNGFFRWKEKEYIQGFGDINYTVGIQLMKQTPYKPAARFTIGETFPTGEFRNLNPLKADIASTGGGVFSTHFSLAFSKVFWKIKKHPISVRFAGSYEIPNHRAKVKGFNSYGGGHDTDGRVDVGHNIQADFGAEISLTQKWVFATDIAYDFSFASTFEGVFGTNPDGTQADVGGPSNDQLSLAPAIEYNMTSKAGLIAGVWFSVTGRNSAVFTAGVISYTQAF